MLFSTGKGEFMKKIIIVLFSIILSSCIQYPIYHSHTQVIDVSQIRQQYPQAEIIYDGNVQHGDKIELFRSWFDKELVVKQKGFKDKHINIESNWTDDAWAEGSCIGMGCSTNKKSTLSLLNPNQALWIPVGLVGIISTPIGMITSPFSEVKENFKLSLKAIFLYPYNLISVLGLPLINPWKEYDTKTISEKISLEPEELKQNL